MIWVNLPTAYMVFPHCTSWRTLSNGVVCFSNAGVPAAGTAETGPVATTAAAALGRAPVTGDADATTVDPEAPTVTSAITSQLPRRNRRCQVLRIVPPERVAGVVLSRGA